MATITEQFKTADEYWHGMVIPDRDDFFRDPGNLRLAMHSAISLSHMSDWLWIEHSTEIYSHYSTTKKGKTKPVDTSAQFAEALCNLNEDFERIRHAANAIKHLEVTKRTPTASNAPTNAANVQSQSVTSFSGGAFNTYGLNEAPLNGGAVKIENYVILEGSTNLRFDGVVRNTIYFWEGLRSNHGW